jgi:hypothetical protein
MAIISASGWKLKTVHSSALISGGEFLVYFSLAALYALIKSSSTSSKTGKIIILILDN